MKENFEIPICQAITKDIPVAGGSRNVVILNTTMAAVAVMGFENFLILPVFLFTHILIIFATKKDQKFFECFKKYIKHKRYYHP